MREQIKEGFRYTIRLAKRASGVEAYKWCMESTYSHASDRRSRMIEGVIHGGVEALLLPNTSKYGWRDQFDAEEEGRSEKNAGLYTLKHLGALGGGIVADSVIFLAAANLTPDASLENALAAKFIMNLAGHSAIDATAATVRSLRSGIQKFQASYRRSTIVV